MNTVIGILIGSVVGYLISKLLIFIYNLIVNFIDHCLTSAINKLDWEQSERQFQWHIEHAHAFDFKSMLWKSVNK